MYHIAWKFDGLLADYHGSIKVALDYYVHACQLQVFTHIATKQ